DGFMSNDVLTHASIIAESESDNPIDIAIMEKIKELQIGIPAYTKIDFTPADSKRKRSTIFIRKDNKDMVISVGAPQIIIEYCVFDDATKEKFNREVETLAKGGYRTLAVALVENSNEEKQMKLVGLL